MRKKIFAVGNSYYLGISLLLFYVEHFSACINAKQSDGNFHFFDSKKSAHISAPMQSQFPI